MPLQETLATSFEIPPQMGRAIGDYAITLKNARDAAASLTEADAAIDAVNGALPEGYMIGTFTPSDEFGKFYSVTEEGLVKRGELHVGAGEDPFLGQRLERRRNGLLLINTEHQLGIKVVRNVFTINLGSTDRRSKELKDGFQSLLGKIGALKPGERKRLAHDW